MKKNSFGRTKGYKGVDRKVISKTKKSTGKIKLADNKKKSNLKAYLQSVYNNYINLETTCNHQLCCCETAMPSMNLCEFTQIITDLWNKLDSEQKINLICKSVEYFFKYDYEKWNRETLIKPCMFLNREEKICDVYENRPLSCRLYGLWPNDMYNRRVDKFEKAYSKYGLKREDLPLNTQCPFVKRKDESKPMTEEAINTLFAKLDEMDYKMGDFTSLQVAQKENYRTFHDWLLFRIYGEEWLSKLTTFIMAASKEVMQDQLEQITIALKENFLKNGVPDITKGL